MSLEYQQNYVTASYEDALLRLFEGRYDDNFQAVRNDFFVTF